jgi:hypothetical protein
MSAYAPYHVEYMSDLKLSDGRKITIRPVRTEDCSLMAELHDQLSAQPDYKALFSSELFTGRLPVEVLSLLCWSPCDRTLVLVAESEDRQRSLAGVCVLFRRPSGEMTHWVAVDQRYPRREVDQALVSQAEVVAEREGLIENHPV